jgi:hypothetical protein
MFLQEHSGDLRFFLWRTRRALTGKTDLRYVIEIKLVEDGYRNNGTGKCGGPELWNSHNNYALRVIASESISGTPTVVLSAAKDLWTLPGTAKYIDPSLHSG